MSAGAGAPAHWKEKTALLRSRPEARERWGWGPSALKRELITGMPLSSDRVSGSSYLRGQIYRELAAVVGPSHISDDPELLQSHAHDWSWMSKYLLYKKLALPAADIAVSPASTEEVREIVRIASTFKVPLVPRGGGTGTQGGTLALYGGISVDLSRMNRILDLDEESLVVTTEVGIDGPTLDKELNGRGLTLAHYPGAYEMGASVGGFIAARGSGVVSTKYGKAENQVLQLKVVVTPGRVIQTLPVPSHASGSDLLQTFVGSEGTLGIMTEAVMRLDPLPETRVFLSFSFPDIFAGMEAGRLIMTRRLRPAVIRLYDEGDAKKLAEWVGTPFTGTLMVVMCDGTKALTDYESGAITALCEQAGGRSLGPNAGQIWWDGKYEPYKKGKLPQPPLLYGTTRQFLEVFGLRDLGWCLIALRLLDRCRRCGFDRRRGGRLGGRLRSLGRRGFATELRPRAGQTEQVLYRLGRLGPLLEPVERSLRVDVDARRLEPGLIVADGLVERSGSLPHQPQREVDLLVVGPELQGGCKFFQRLCRLP